MERVEVLTNPSCPHCLLILDRVTEFAVREGVAISAIDVLHHPEVAQRLGFEHSPVILCAGHAISDMPTPEEFHALVTGHRNA